MKTKKSIIVLLCVIIALGGVYFFITRDTSKNEPSVAEKEKTETVQRKGTPVFETEKEKISSLKINNEDSFEIYPKDGKWFVKDREELLFNQAQLNSTVLDYLKVIPSLTVEDNSENKASFGLENPIASATVTTTDGVTKSFYLGDATKGGNGYYFMVSDDEHIYTISNVLAENMKKIANSYRTTSLMDVKPDEIKEVTMTVYGVGEVNVKRLDEQIDVMTSWKMTKPFDLGVYDEKFGESVISPITSVAISGFVSDDPSEEQLEKSGLINPKNYYEVKTADKDYKILIGNNYDGNYIVKRSDLPSVYLIPAESLVFLTVDIFDYLNSYAYLPARADFESITTTVDGVDYDFLQKDYSDKGKRKLLINGISVDDKVYTEGYKSIVGIKIDGKAKNVPENPNAPEFSYTVNMTDGTSETVSYVRMNGMYMYQFINGNCQFYVKAAEVDAAKNGIKAALKAAENPEPTDKEKKAEKAAKEKRTTNKLAYLVVILIICLIAVFPISMLVGSKKKK